MSRSSPTCAAVKAAMSARDLEPELVVAVEPLPQLPSRGSLGTHNRHNKIAAISTSSRVARFTAKPAGICQVN